MVVTVKESTVEQIARDFHLLLCAGHLIALSMYAIRNRKPLWMAFHACAALIDGKAVLEHHRASRAA